MNRLFFLLFLVFFVFSHCSSQTINPDDVGKVCLGVRIIENNHTSEMQYAQLLSSRISDLATQYGFLSNSNSRFFVSTSVIIDNVDVAEGGMKNVYVVKGQLMFNIEDGDIIYSSKRLPIKGSGTKKENAIKDAILNASFNSLQSFFEDSKQKIGEYYIQHKDAIFAKANVYVASGDYDKAITCLMMIPEDNTDLYRQAAGRAVEIYQMKVKKEQDFYRQELLDSNERILKASETFLAAHHPYDALLQLADFQDGDSRQEARYRALIKKAESLISAKERAQAQKELLQRQDKLRNERRAYNLIIKDMDLQSQKINVVKTVACEYLRNNPSFRYYIYY